MVLCFQGRRQSPTPKHTLKFHELKHPCACLQIKVFGFFTSVLASHNIFYRRLEENGLLSFLFQLLTSVSVTASVCGRASVRNKPQHKHSALFLLIHTSVAVTFGKQKYHFLVQLTRIICENTQKIVSLSFKQIIFFAGGSLEKRCLFASESPPPPPPSPRSRRVRLQLLPQDPSAHMLKR